MTNNNESLGQKITAYALTGIVSLSCFFSEKANAMALFGFGEPAYVKRERIIEEAKENLPPNSCVVYRRHNDSIYKLLGDGDIVKIGDDMLCEFNAVAPEDKHSSKSCTITTQKSLAFPGGSGLKMVGHGDTISMNSGVCILGHNKP